MKRFAAILAASGALAAAGAALAPVAFAGPDNPHANCTAVEASNFGDISSFATLPHPGSPDYVAGASSTDCGTR